MSGQDEALRLAEEVGGEIDSLKAELRSIDNVLARRPALADFGTRLEKVEHACSTAGRATDKVTRLEAALTAAAERETKLCEELDMAARETARLLAVNGESNAVCSCGCELVDHEERGEDGWSCDNESHECVPTSMAVAQMLRTLREENDRLTAANESVAVCRKHVADITADGCWVCSAQAAEAEVERLKLDRDSWERCALNTEVTLQAERQKMQALRARMTGPLSVVLNDMDELGLTGETK